MIATVKRLGKNTIIYGVGSTLNRFIGLLLLPLFTSYLTTADYGITSILGLVTFIATSIFALGFGVSIGLCYFEGDNPQHKVATIWTASAVLLLSVYLMVTLGNLYSRPISHAAYQSGEYARFIPVALLYAAFSILITPFQLRLQFEEKAVHFVFLTATSTILTISLNIILVVTMRMGVWGYVLGNMAGQGITLLLFFASAARGLPFHIEKKLSRELLRLGLSLVPSFSLFSIIQQGNKYILQYFRGLNEAGIYTIGFNLGMAFNIVITAFQSAWYPFYMSYMEKQEEGRQLFARITTCYIFGMGAVNLLFYIWARPVVMLMTHQDFHGAWTVVGITASSILFIGLFAVILPGMYFVKEVKFVLPNQAVSAALSVMVNLLLIPTVGYTGASIGMEFGFLTMVVVTHLFNRLRHYLDVRYKWNRLELFTLVYLALATVSILVPAKPVWMLILLPLMFSGLLALGVYALLSARERTCFGIFPSAGSMSAL